ncbi:MAG: hypothetical protein U0N15_05990 [Bifidobacterium choerinum]
MRTHKELERQLSAAAEGNRCLHPTDGAVHRALLRRKRTGDVVSPMPGLFIGSEVWGSLNPIMQLTYVVRGLAQWHPDRVFTGLAAACILGLWMELSVGATDVEESYRRYRMRRTTQPQ